MPLPGLKAYNPEYQPPREEDKPEPAAQLPVLKPAEAEPGRPYEDYVNSEVRRFWQETVKEHNLTKPLPQEIRAAAMTILCHARRRRTGGPPRYRAHLAVDAMQLNALERGHIEPPYSRLGAYPDYLEALIQLADDTGLSREIPLPDHPPPKHSPIYYTMYSGTGRPVPAENSLIRAHYVYTPEGMRITRDEYIRPWPDPLQLPPVKYDLLIRGWDACYTLRSGQDNVPEILLHWIKEEQGSLVHAWESLESMIFSPYQPPVPGSCNIL